MNQCYLWATPSGPINLIKAEDMPMMNHWPEGTPMYSDYNDALQRAKESSIPVQDQDAAKRILNALPASQFLSCCPGDHSFNKSCLMSGKVYGPFNITYELQPTCDPGICNSWETCYQNKRCMAQVAILLPEKERPDYINKEFKKVSESDLKAALREVNLKNKEIRDSYEDHTRLDFRIKDSRGFPTGDVVEEAKIAPKAELSPRVAKLILSTRDELLKLEHCPEEAYHLLYQIASPSFDKTDPWLEIEKIAADTPEEDIDTQFAESAKAHIRNAPAKTYRAVPDKEPQGIPKAFDYVGFMKKQYGEETQESILDELINDTFGATSAGRKSILEKFTITRNQ